jgi:hypothetical protein
MQPNPQSYAPAIVELLATAGVNDLGSGSPNSVARSMLAGLNAENLVAPHPVKDMDMARACLAGLWLRHDFLDESHRISQDIENPTGSFWHGIMHRREGDFGNAKYWFRRVGVHPVFEPLAEFGRELADGGKVGPPAAYLARQANWDPFAFVDLCQLALTTKQPLESLVKKIQQREWELLFDHCYRQAIGNPAAR